MYHPPFLTALFLSPPCLCKSITLPFLTLPPQFLSVYHFFLYPLLSLSVCHFFLHPLFPLSVCLVLPSLSLSLLVLSFSLLYQPQPVIPVISQACTFLSFPLNLPQSLWFSISCCSFSPFFYSVFLNVLRSLTLFPLSLSAKIYHSSFLNSLSAISLCCYFSVHPLHSVSICLILSSLSSLSPVTTWFHQPFFIYKYSLSLSYSHFYLSCYIVLPHNYLFTRPLSATPVPSPFPSLSLSLSLYQSPSLPLPHHPLTFSFKPNSFILSQIKDAYMLKIFEDNQTRLPGWCVEADGTVLPYCQIRGEYRMDLPDYNTLLPYPHMNERCPSLPPLYNRASNC